MVKVGFDTLRRLIYGRLGPHDEDVIVGPKLGEDAAIIRVNSGYLVTHVDPITGALESIGPLSIYVPANDIAVRGVRPRWFLLTILLPGDCDEGTLDSIMRGVEAALGRLKASLVGGHTECTPNLGRPILISTAIGMGSRYVTTAGARVGDVVLVTKYVAIEGTMVLATDFKDELKRRGVSDDVLESSRRLIDWVSVVDEAIALADLATSMHDPTEGGLLQGLIELAEASGVGLRVYAHRIPILRETKAIFDALNLDPLRALGSGMLIATIPKDSLDKAADALSKLGVNYSVIGEVIDGEPRIELVRDYSVELIRGFIQDEVMRLWNKQLNTEIRNSKGEDPSE